MNGFDSDDRCRRDAEYRGTFFVRFGGVPSAEILFAGSPGSASRPSTSRW